MTDTTTGATITFGTSGFSQNWQSIGLPGANRGSYDTTHLGTTTARTHAPIDLVDWGTLEIEFDFDPDDRPPIDQPAETITITWPLPSGGSTAATLVGSGFMTDYTVNGPLEEKMTATATIKWSGDLTFTAAT
ncbi:MAG: hypothetical protein KJN67_04460 [Pontiella sp.]|nr:hypothetical protein [Pontiella sp.]